jgi:Cu+-exporting ATPase
MPRVTSAITPVRGPAGGAAPIASRSRLRVPGRPAVCAVLTAGVLAVAATGHPARAWVALALSAPVIAWGGWPLHRAAWSAARRGAVTADTLACVGVVATFGVTAGAATRGPVGAVPLLTAAAATTLLLAGRAAEARIARRAGAVLDAADVEPGTGDRFEVGPGERIAADGVVVVGRSAVAATATGIVEVGAGDAVTAGGRNAGNRLVVRATGPSAGARLAERAWRGAAALHHVADRASAGFVAVVIALTVATLGFWLGAGAGAGAAVGTAAALLLAACPRVIGRAAAAAVLAGVGRGVELGVGAGPGVLEHLARADTMVLCRTGTVTTGDRELRAVHVAPGVDPDKALRIAGAVAAAGQDAGGHAVGALIAREARDRFGELPGVAEFDGYPGLGVRGVVAELRDDPDGDPRVIAHAALVGRAALLAEHGISLPAELAATADRARAAGSTAVAVAWDGVARAVLEVADPLRPGAAEAVGLLRGLGLTPVLLTGDDVGTARGLAAALGVEREHVVAEVPPAERADAVERLRSGGRTVAVLGGPADAAALAAADAALLRGPEADERSDAVTLRDDDPLTAVDAVRVARRTVGTVERALTAVAAYHLAALPLAAAGLLTPLVAAAAAAACPVAVVAYALAPRRVRPVPRRGSSPFDERIPLGKVSNLPVEVDGRRRG